LRIEGVAAVAFKLKLLDFILEAEDNEHLLEAPELIVVEEAK
jgi:hypothetical protein